MNFSKFIQTKSLFSYSCVNVNIDQWRGPLINVNRREMVQATCTGRKLNIYKFIVIMLYWINGIAV